MKKTVNPFPWHGQMGGNGAEDSGGFKNIGEFFYRLAEFKSSGQRDERLDRCYEAREMVMGIGSSGGFALPTQFDATLRRVDPAQQVMRPRATVISAGSPPDAELQFPLLDQTSGKGMYGGCIITHTGEALAMTETTAAIRQVSLTPKEMSAYIIVSDKLLRNWDSCGTFIGGILQQAMNGREDFDMLRVRASISV